ncbi:MAG: CinA family protein [Sulfurimonas sp.]|jgi:nicotinamide-nucleotide amidase|nr:CinA family protein [Sulfurimonas sp.]
MKLSVLFIGNKFISNQALREYILRSIEKNVDFISTITYFKENDNSLFLHLEHEFNLAQRLLIITSKQNFSTIGKVICTVTSDNQILKDSMLIPQKSSVFEEGSYLLEYKQTLANVIHIDEMQKFPEILFEKQESKAVVHIFEDDRESALAVLSPIAQTNDVTIDIVTLIEGWQRVDISSKRYGNISNFIHSAKKLLKTKLIPASNIILYIIETLSNNNKTITFAESCTGGLLTYYFTKENGASKILHGSLVTYSNDLKENWLAVEGSTLEAYGAVSNEVVEQMSEGAMNVSNADYALSISGIAGDTGGTELKPVGTVHIGVRSHTEHKETRLQLSGDRNYVQHQSVLYALKMLLLIDKESFF